MQQTFLEAQQDFQGFHGDSEVELLAWLRRLLLNNLANFARHYRGSRKRAIGRERQLPGADSADRAFIELTDTAPSPSSIVRQDEEDVALKAAIAGLPSDYRQVITWRYEEDLSFAEIGKRLNRSANAAQKLWFRAVERLRENMEGTS